MTALKKIFLPLPLLLLLAACRDDEKKPLDVPVNYDGSAFSTQAATELGVLTRLTSLVNEAKKGRTPGRVVKLDSLNYWFTTGTPALQSISTLYYTGLTLGPGGWLDQLAKASGKTWMPGTLTGDGGAFGGYLFDKNGLEPEQMIEKGLFGAVLFNHFNKLAAGNITAATVDQMSAIYGAHPSFPNSYQSKHANPDRFGANYAARRDKNDGRGFYAQIRDQFIKLQAAVKAGPDYNPERDEAIAEIRLLWEKSNFATVVNYCYAVVSALSATNPTDAQKGAALHAYSECVGFVQGWRTVSPKKIGDAQIDELLVLLNAPAGSKATSYKFVTEAPTELPKLLQAIDKIKGIYGFSAQDLEDFKRNWVLDQNR
jgi:hypothetical protein